MAAERKKAIISGGSRGIGRGVALVLAKAGYDIAFSYNTATEEAQSLRDEIISLGGRSFLYQVNFENDGVAVPFVEQAIKDLGGLDLLVCNAGKTRFNSLLAVDEEFINKLFNLDYRSYIIMAGAAARYFTDTKVKGNIIFISSTRGFRAYPEDCVYGSFKAALIRAVESMALEMGQYGVRVNCIAPGATANR
ncbi:MAG: SDR family oxidoreductase, partial [Treponema sp.]|nr:SDR family oxidoreductase [Treponema sp.]